MHHIWLKATCNFEHLRCASHRSIPTQTTAAILPPALCLCLSVSVSLSLSQLPHFLPLSFFSHLRLLVCCHQLSLPAAALSAPPGNRNAAPPAYRRLVSSVPSDVISSWDWKVRCAWQQLLWKRAMPREISFIKALEQRLKLVDTAPAFPLPCFDLLGAATSSGAASARGRLRHQTGRHWDRTPQGVRSGRRRLVLPQPGVFQT